MIKILSIQEAFLQKNLVAEIEIEAITPILIGGYDTKTHHKKLGIFEPLRTSSIKGVWRWWARALIAAVYKEKYYRYLNLADADKLVEKLLGSSQIDIGQCKYILHVIKLSHGKPIPFKELKKIPRIKFARIRDKIISPGAKFTVKIYRIKDTKKVEDKFTIESLILALIFDGIGKITSRGFGKVKIVNFKSKTLYIIEKLVKQIYNSRNHNDLKNSIIKLINESLKTTEELLNDLCKEKQCIKSNTTYEINKLPPIELPLIENKNNLMLLFIPKKKFNNTITILKCINNSTLKLYHKALKYLNQSKNFSNALNIARSKIGKNIHTWILGLPRAQSLKISCNEISSREQAEECAERIRNKLKDSLKESLKGSSEKINEDLFSSISNKLGELVKIEENINEKGEKFYKIRIPTGYYIITERGYVDLVMRRKSPIRFTVIPVGISYYIVVFGFKTDDWKEASIKLLYIGAKWKKEDKKLINFSTKLIDLKAENINKKIEETVSDIIKLIEKNYCLAR